MIKRWFYKRQLKYWQNNLFSLEFAIEYSNLPDGDEMISLMEAHKEYTTIIEALKLLINGTTTYRETY